FYPLIALVILAACSDSDKKEAIAPPESPEKLYSEARAKIDSSDYKDAVKAFEEVERQHPYSQWAVDAQVMSAYASYQAEDYDGAVSTLERFVKLYPNSDSSPYAYYLIA